MSVALKLHQEADGLAYDGRDLQGAVNSTLEPEHTARVLRNVGCMGEFAYVVYGPPRHTVRTGTAHTNESAQAAQPDDGSQAVHSERLQQTAPDADDQAPAGPVVKVEDFGKIFAGSKLQ